MSDAPKDIKCERCGVTVPIDKVDVPDRCTDERCPLKRKTQ